MICLNDLAVARCLHPPGFLYDRVGFHHFPDASTLGYGQCSYVRIFDVSLNVHVSFLFGKSRDTPLR